MNDMTPEQLDRWRALDWKLIPGAPTQPLLNMALDEVLAERVGRGERPPTLRIWGWNRPCIVLGRFQSVRNEVDEEAAARTTCKLCAASAAAARCSSSQKGPSPGRSTPRSSWSTG